jgi:hypothetical protein
MFEFEISFFNLKSFKTNAIKHPLDLVSTHTKFNKMINFINVIGICLLSLSHCLLVEGAATTRKPHEIRPGRFPDVDRFDEIYYIVRNSLLLLISPCIISFVWAIYRDPATPLVAKAAWSILKRRVAGNLSTKSDDMY